MEIRKINYSQLYEEYKSGIKVETLAINHSLHRLTIVRNFKKLGLKTRLHRSRYIVSVSAEVIKSYYEEHKTGLTIEQLVEKYNKTRKYFLHHFKYYKLPVIIHRESWRIESKEIYPKDHNFFSVIDTELKAYLLGFFTADGSISSNENYIIVTSNDSYITELFRDTIAPGLQLISSNKAMVFNCYSKQIVTDLKALGLCVRKSWAELSVPYLDPKFIPHYIRGVFDGDGWCSVGVCKNGGMHRTWGVCGGKSQLQYLTQVADFLAFAGVDIKINSRKGDGLIKIIVKNLKSYFILYDYLYKDATYYLERKHNKLKLCLVTPRELRELTNFQPRNA